MKVIGHSKKKNAKTVNRNSYVNFAPNVNIVKRHGAVNPRIVPTLSLPIPSAHIV